MEFYEIIGMIVIFWLVIAIVAFCQCKKGPCSRSAVSKSMQAAQHFQSQTLTVVTDCSSMSYTNLFDQNSIHDEDQISLNSDESFPDPCSSRATKQYVHVSDAPAVEFFSSKRNWQSVFVV